VVAGDGQGCAEHSPLEATEELVDGRRFADRHARDERLVGELADAPRDRPRSSVGEPVSHQVTSTRRVRRRG
jgi:hypothetical protein